MPEFINFPRQKLPFSQKTKKWRKTVLDWADSKTFFNFSLVEKSVIHKKINYDLLNGILHMNDLMAFINPDDIKANYNIDEFVFINQKDDSERGDLNYEALNLKKIGSFSYHDVYLFEK